MSDSQALPTATTSITSTAVLKELKELRQYRGITILRVQERAPQIQRLAVTLDEAARRRLAEGDHHVAAYYAIQCAVSYGVRRPDLVHILRQTLNFAEEDNFLDDRRASLIAEFDSRSKLYGRLEEEAYVQLAGFLVAIDRSACRESAALELATPATIDLRLTIERQSDLRWLLTLLTVDKRQPAQDALSSALLARLPRGTDRALQVFPTEADVRPDVTARWLLSLALIRLERTGALVAGYTLGFVALTDVLLSTRPDTHWTATVAAERDPSHTAAALVERGRRGLSWPTRSFYTRKQRGITTVAEYLRRVEQRDGWSDEIAEVDADPIDVYRKVSRIMSKADQPLGLLIVADESDRFDSPLDDLLLQLEPFSANLQTKMVDTGASTKGIGGVIEIAIPLVALKVSGAAIAPLLAAWLARPRSQRITVHFDNGRAHNSFRIEGESQDSQQFSKAIEDIVRNIEFPDQP